MSIRTKLFLALFFLTIFPYAVTSFFIFKNEENLLKQNIKNQQIQNLSLIQKNIQNYFSSLRKNLTFWSKAQILDDILTEDIDKRIQIFLDQIKRNYALKGKMFVIDNRGKIIASTDKEFIGKYINNFPFFSSDRYIKISLPVFASFNRRKIGYMVFILNAHNLKNFLYKNSLSSLSLYNRKTGLNVGFVKHFPENLLKNKIYETEKFLYISEPFRDKTLEEWFLVSQIDKSIAFLPLIDAKNYFIAVFLGGFLLISVFSFYMSKKLVRPIKEISQTMEEVVKKKDYSKRVSYSGKDEIAVLSKSFNYMISEIEKALKTIEEENRNRLRLFKNLIDIFSKITSVQKEEEVLSVAVKELKRFLKDVKLYFSEEKNGFFSIDIKTEKIKGFLIFETERDLSEEEKEFFLAIGKLINLLLEKVELLNKSQAASKAKSAFISNMSHELRTPLNSIIGFSQYLQTVEEDNTKKQALKSIEISGKHLLEMINDILDYAKLEAGAIKVKKETFSLKEMLDEVKSIIKPLSDEKGLKLILPEDNIVLNTDKKLLKQILINLLSNAVKFTENGYIKLSVWKEDKWVFFSVKDTGIGIKKEHLENIFKSFTQLENPLQKKYKGTGLGLAITKEYLKLLGGDIKARSEGVGKGAEFILKIPLKKGF